MAGMAGVAGILGTKRMTSISRITDFIQKKK